MRKPQKIGFVDSFNGELRDEWVYDEVFATSPKSRLLIKRWRIADNRIRPRASHSGRTPEARHLNHGAGQLHSLQGSAPSCYPTIQIGYEDG